VRMKSGSAHRRLPKHSKPLELTTRFLLVEFALQTSAIPASLSDRRRLSGRVGTDVRTTLHQPPSRDDDLKAASRPQAVAGRTADR